MSLMERMGGGGGWGGKEREGRIFFKGKGGFAK